MSKSKKSKDIVETKEAWAKRVARKLDDFAKQDSRNLLPEVNLTTDPA